jgi:hypothetical protein
MGDQSENVSVRFVKWLLWRTARCDNRERWWWNTVNHRVLGGPPHSDRTPEATDG